MSSSVLMCPFRIRHNLTIQFVKIGYNMSLLLEEKQ